MASLQTGNFSDALKTMYEKRLLTRAQPRLVHGRWARIARFVGYKDYELRKYAALAIADTPLSEGVTPDEFDEPGLSTITITPVWYGTWLRYTELLDLTNFDPIVSETVAILGEQAGLTMDTLIRDHITANATKNYSGAATARTEIDEANDEISFSDILINVAALDNENANGVEGDNFGCIIHPFSWASLMKDSTFVAMFQNSDPAAIREGELGRLLRCVFYRTSNARSYASTETVYSMLFVGAESYGIAGFGNLVPNIGVDGAGVEVRNRTGQTTKPVEIIAKGLGEGGDDPLNQRGSIGWKMTQEEAILNSAWIRDCEHANVNSVAI